MVVLQWKVKTVVRGLQESDWRTKPLETVDLLISWLCGVMTRATRIGGENKSCESLGIFCQTMIQPVGMDLFASRRHSELRW